MVGKKVARETLLPSVHEDDGDEGHEEETLGGIRSRPPSRPRNIYSRGSVDSQTVVRASGCRQRELSAGEKSEDDDGADEEEEEEEECDRSSEAVDGQEGAGACFTVDEDYDTELEPEDKPGRYDLTGEARYREACEMFNVVPVSYFLRNIQSTEVSMMHHGLGPQLNLRDNGMEGEGGAAIADMLKENLYITEIDLSENRLGECGIKALASMLLENTSLISLNLSGNHLDERAAKHLAPALTKNQHLQHLDLSHNRLGEAAGELLGAAVAENTGMKSLSLSWNCIRGKGAIALAKGLSANIFLQTVDLSYNGLGKEGASVLGEGLKDNNTLEELNISINRIPPEGAVHLAVGLKANNNLRILKMARNPVRSAGCFAVLKAVEGNPSSSMEYLDFSDISVDQEFEDLFNSIKETLPNFQVKHGGKIRPFQNLQS
ncbi:leucine-rich repeat-containing protein 74B isoform X2 [Ictalurus punctatus]|uniref:Leucine-rich repeat-containing protein 74B isoform X2 n=1 Tax=Ictalurus punctatus TaxID=7998 RepID=A0A2D0PL88_ICTPU|nr:leucine-rich repeat-containing protein 74B isoform X2 [Ictalurus punctatus]